MDTASRAIKRDGELYDSCFSSFTFPALSYSLPISFRRTRYPGMITRTFGLVPGGSPLSPSNNNNWIWIFPWDQNGVKYPYCYNTSWYSWIYWVGDKCYFGLALHYLFVIRKRALVRSRNDEYHKVWSFCEIATVVKLIQWFPTFLKSPPLDRKRSSLAPPTVRTLIFTI